MVHVGHSRSAGFWCAIRALDKNTIYFSYGKSHLDQEIPVAGRRVTFVPLPPIVGTKYPRATEVALQPT